MGPELDRGEEKAGAVPFPRSKPVEERMLPVCPAGRLPAGLAWCKGGRALHLGKRSLEIPQHRSPRSRAEQSGQSAEQRPRQAVTCVALTWAAL